MLIGLLLPQDEKRTGSSARPMSSVLASPLFPLPVELCWICCCDGCDGSPQLYRHDHEVGAAPPVVFPKNKD